MASIPGISDHPKRAVTVALIAWIALAIVVWNVVFDRVLVLAGRRYVYTAYVAAGGSRPYVSAGDWMQAAIGDGLRLATAIAGSLLIVGLASIAFATRKDRSRNAA
jgi:hypothetical protein